jgi:hypothetical protein
MTPAQNLIKQLRKFEPKSWLRRRTWHQLIRGPSNAANQVRYRKGGDVAQLPGGVTEVRPPPATQLYPDMPAVSVSEDQDAGTRTWVLPPWSHKIDSQHRLAQYEGVTQYEPFSLTMLASEVPVLVAVVRDNVIDGVPFAEWGTSQAPYWEPAPADAPDINHPSPYQEDPPPDEEDDEEDEEDEVEIEYPTAPYTQVVASVSAAFATSPANVQILR